MRNKIPIAIKILAMFKTFLNKFILIFCDIISAELFTICGLFNMKNQKQPIKTKPTIIPMAFSIGAMDNDLIVIDFKDVINGEEQILESIAMTKNKALRLSEGLREAIDILNKTQDEK